MLGNVGLWAGISLLGFSLMLFCQSLSFDYYNQLGPGPGFLPRWVSGALIVVTLLYIWESVRGGIIAAADVFPRGDVLKDIALMIGGLCIFALIVERIGFGLSGSLLVFLMTVRKYRWYYALPASIAISFAVAAIFQNLLGVPLPVNDFGW